MNTKTKIGLAAVIAWTLANNLGSYLGYKAYKEAGESYRETIETQAKHINLLECQLLEARMNV